MTPSDWPVANYLDTLPDPCLVLQPDTDAAWRNTAANRQSSRVDVVPELRQAVQHARLPLGATLCIELSGNRKVEVSSVPLSAGDILWICRFLPAPPSVPPTSALAPASLEKVFSRVQGALDGYMPMLKRILSHPFEDTELGPVSQWPASLQTAVFITLSIPWPCCLCWGRNYILMYNTAYSRILGK
jgi:hypothetical protein